MVRPMRSPIIALAFIAAAALAGCGSTNNEPDLQPQIDAIEQVGRDFRDCEVRAASPDCRFAVRDATKTTSAVWRAYQEADLLESDEAESAFGIMEGWSRWNIRCDGESNEYALWCLNNAPEEKQAQRAASLLRQAAQTESA